MPLLKRYCSFSVCMKLGRGRSCALCREPEAGRSFFLWHLRDWIWKKFIYFSLNQKHGWPWAVRNPVRSKRFKTPFCPNVLGPMHAYHPVEKRRRPSRFSKSFFVVSNSCRNHRSSLFCFGNCEAHVAKRKLEAWNQTRGPKKCNESKPWCNHEHQNAGMYFNSDSYAGKNCHAVTWVFIFNHLGLWVDMETIIQKYM